MADIKEELKQLEAVPMPELKKIWRQYFRHSPVRFQREYMIRRIAHQMQVKEYGGLPKTILNRLQRLAEEGQEKIREQYKLAPGTKLMREYKGERLYVTILESGFEFKGKRYQSLTGIATELMGSRTSGPKFFGIIGGKHDQ
jgi:hypothetical protein